MRLLTCYLLAFVLPLSFVAQAANKPKDISNELYESEFTYTEGLLKLSLLSSAIIAKKKPAKAIFGSFDIKLLTELKKNVVNIGNKSPVSLFLKLKDAFSKNRVSYKECVSIVDSIRKHFTDKNLFFNPYKAFLNKYKNYEKLRKDFEAYRKDYDPNLSSNYFPSLLITPVQRFPRYGLLFKDLWQGLLEDYKTNKSEDLKALINTVNQVVNTLANQSSQLNEEVK